LRANADAAYAGAAAVFSGRVLTYTSPYREEGQYSVLRPPFVAVVRMTVDRVWKGDLEQEVVVTNAVGNCFYPLQVGEEYLVWASRTPRDTDWGVADALAADYGICGWSRVGPISEQDEDIRELNTLSRLPPVMLNLLLLPPSVRLLAGVLLLGGIVGSGIVLGARRRWGPRAA
jgi:hypothetical protein